MLIVSTKIQLAQFYVPFTILVKKSLKRFFPLQFRCDFPYAGYFCLRF